jgi:hypothetical protein
MRRAKHDFEVLVSNVLLRAAMSTTALSFNENNFLASPDLVASLLASMGDSRANRRSRAVREIPNWLDHQLLASSQPVAKDMHPSPASPSQRPDAPVAPVAQPVRASRDRPKAFVPEIRTKAPFGAPRGCRCGQCLRCLDNARWDRISNEKFADPTY